MGKFTSKIPDWLKPLPADQRVVVTPFYPTSYTLTVAGDRRHKQYGMGANARITSSASGGSSVPEEKKNLLAAVDER